MDLKVNWQESTQEQRDKVKAYMLKHYPEDWNNLESFKIFKPRLETIERITGRAERNTGNQPPRPVTE